MIVIADSGATKTQWRIIQDGRMIADFETIGMNPYFCSHAEYKRILTESFPINPKGIKKVFFYSAGCGTNENADLARNALVEFFNGSEVGVYSDILGAALALFGRGNGIAIILGTGTNIGYYNGENVKHYTPSLGYVLGDEGGGAYLGKQFVRRWLYNEFPDDFSEQIKAHFGYSLSQILLKVYTEPFPGRFLASFVPFMAENMANPHVESIVSSAFGKLVSSHLTQYPMFPSEPIGVVGTIGVVFQKFFIEAIEKYGGRITNFERYPIDKLQLFHSNHTE